MFLLLLYTIIISSKLVSSYVIVLSGDNDIIQGETVQFKAEVHQDDGRSVTDIDFKFEWSDNATPQNTAEFKTKSPSIWNVTYNSSFPAHKYTVTVKVSKFTILLFTVIGSSTKTFNVTPYLKGDLVLLQGNYTRNKYVSNVEPVVHKIVLKKSHLDFLNKTTNYLRTFWFVDCVYYGQQKGFEFSFNFTKLESIHHVEALVVATYIPHLLNDTTHQLSINSTETILSNITVQGTNQSLNNQFFIGNSSAPNKTEDVDYLDQSLTKWLKNYNQSHKLTPLKSDYCINSSVIPMASNYTNGFFRTNFTVKSPIKISPINGTNWLMDGEILNINVSCNGSSPFSFCVILKPGLYNVTGNETCNKNERILQNCSFGIHRLFKKPSEYTIVVIISNAVSHVVKPIAVNIYKVKKHAQLSVITVPVSFSLIATILIIFGVAHYVQNKRKYTIEVADFDFGNQTSNMEYKTFTERLRESISNSFLKSHDYQENEDSWPESASNSRKYGSME